MDKKAAYNLAKTVSESDMNNDTKARLIDGIVMSIDRNDVVRRIRRKKVDCIIIAR